MVFVQFIVFGNIENKKEDGSLLFYVEMYSIS